MTSANDVEHRVREERAPVNMKLCGQREIGKEQSVPWFLSPLCYPEIDSHVEAFESHLPEIFHFLQRRSVMLTHQFLAYAAIGWLANSCFAAPSDNKPLNVNERDNFPVSPYKIIARPGPGVGFDFLPVQARGLNFYIGGPPGTYCPQQVSDCPSGTETLFAGLGSLVSSRSSCTM